MTAARRNVVIHKQVVQIDLYFGYKTKWNDVTAVCFAMDQLGEKTLKDNRRRLFTTLFEAMLFCYFDNGVRKNVVLCLAAIRAEQNTSVFIVVYVCQTRQLIRSFISVRFIRFIREFT